MGLSWGWVRVGLGLGWVELGLGMGWGWVGDGWGLGSGVGLGFKTNSKSICRTVGRPVYTDYNTLYGLPLGNPFRPSVAIKCGE